VGTMIQERHTPMAEKPKHVGSADSKSTRGRQLAYSELQALMLNEESRRQKASKIISVLQHFLGREDLDGLKTLDIGCSTGFISEALHKAGAVVTGLDIDEPGLVAARERCGDRVKFICAGGEDIPAPPQSFDIVVFNQIYEHVVDADAIMTEIRRVLRPDGAVYLGLGNRLRIIEPHYKLPFLSWLPKRAADRYIRATGKAPTYYETFRTRPNLRRMCEGLNVWDYTYTVLTQSRKFAADDIVPSRLSSAPVWFWKSLAPIIPTFIWVGTPGSRRPAGPATTVPPAAVPARRP
jgi:2-polyprenyl-3-methyl-5-hydroxy-6-metoxy-1,4-benzoquinol methylase